MISKLLLPCWANWLIVLGIIIALIVTFFLVFPVFIWFRTITSKTAVSLWKLFAMRFRKIKVNIIVEAYINCKKSDINISLDELEAHYVAGGDVISLSDGLIMAKNANINLSIEMAKAIDLSGRNVINSVKNSITPKVIQTPVVSAISKDGFEVKAKADITVLALIDKAIGGVDEHTISARVGEALMAEIGACFQYTDFMQKPDVASKNIFDKKLDYNSAFQIMSINISEMSLGKNIEAQTLLDEAEIDKKIAQAKADERKAMAMASEQEMRAKTQEAKAGLIDAESKVPSAIASAFEKGNISINDYYKLENLLADTQMRKKFGEPDKKDR